MTNNVFAIDPGPEESGVVILDEGKAPRGFVLPNAEVIPLMGGAPPRHIAVEMIASYGMPVGFEVFETCVWIGRFIQEWFGDSDPHPEALVYRAEVKLEICHDPRAKDANVRAALIDAYGGKERAVGKKKSPGPLHGFKSHMWPALGVAITYRERLARGMPPQQSDPRREAPSTKPTCP